MPTPHAPTILQTILDAKVDEVASARLATPLADLRHRAADLPPTLEFAAALAQPGTLRIIAELKKASPSVGLIRADFDPAQIVMAYAAGGAACLSVLTDQRWFGGSAETLRTVRATVDLPLLRKDFTVDEYQIYEARTWGADAVLLIVAALSPTQLADYASLAAELGLAALVEVHDEAELELAAAMGARLIGVNNRNLHTFETTLDTTARLRALLPADALIVSESGIKTPDDIRWLRAQGCHAALIGETLMRSVDIAAATREMVQAGSV